MRRIGDDGWVRRLGRHGAGVAMFSGLALAGGALGLVAAPVAWWLPGALFPVVAAIVARTYEVFWRPTPRDCHVRAGVHVVGLAATTHLAGWGALLVPMHLLAASDLQRTTGMAVGSLPVRWAAWVTGAGQLLVWVGVLPTVVPRGIGVGVAALQLLVVRAVVLRLERDEADLAAVADEATAGARRMRAVLATSGSSVVVARAGLVELVSPRVMQLLGLPDDHTLVELLDRVHPDDVDRVALVLAGPAAPRPGEGALRARLQHADGEWREVDVTWRDEPEGADVVVHLRDLTEVDRLREELERAAHVDVLTGLGNRRVLTARLPQVVGLVARRLTVASVLLVDLDGFKDVNDTYGHLVGDELLRDLAGRMRACVRTHDTVVRAGGDEFVVVLEGLRDHEEAGHVARRLVGALAGAHGIAEGPVVRVGASIGVRHVGPTDEVQDLVRDADRAMYLAKRAGGGRVVVHGDAARTAGGVRRQPPPGPSVPAPTTVAGAGPLRPG